MSSGDFSEDELKKEFGEDEKDDRSSTAGGYRFTDQEEIRQQRKQMWTFVKSIGASALQGQDLTKVSLPVIIFEPRSFLERVADNWTGIETLLYKAAQMNHDPVGRLQHVCAFVISGLISTCRARKPFNPILGETFQAEYANGTRVFCEQTSHHPPVSHFQIFGPKDAPFEYSGLSNYVANIRGNSVKGQQLGQHTAKFSDGSKVVWELPYLWLTGVMWGTRVMDYCGSLVVEDTRHKLRAELTFNPDAQGMFKSLFFKQKTPTDAVRGEICKQCEGVERMSLCKLEGSWLTHLDCIQGDGSKVRLWDVKTCKPSTPVPVTNPLPSDCRFREDLKALKEGNTDDAQRWKVVLEEKQRLERKLRAERGKK